MCSKITTAYNDMYAPEVIPETKYRYELKKYGLVEACMILDFFLFSFALKKYKLLLESTLYVLVKTGFLYRI